MLHDLRLHRHLLGQPDSCARLNTPVLLIERAAFERNLKRMMEAARARGVQLRPHAKTHKSAHVAQRQLTAGAVGVCCAKLGEAEALAEQGIHSILITSPVVTPAGVARLAALNARIAELLVVIDHPDNLASLDAVVDRPLKVLIDIDPGIHRTGVVSAQAALELAAGLQRARQLRYCGVQMYCGLQQHIASYAERTEQVRERMTYLRAVIDLLAQHGHAPRIVTGSGTGTHRIDGTLRVFTEWQVGSYLFMDRQYAECELSESGPAPFEYSLFVEASVISTNIRGMATLDAGFKAFATDGGVPLVVSGAPTGTTYYFMGDEHGLIVDPAQQYTWRLGDRVRLAVPHCDPTVNLYDAYHVVHEGVLEDIWPVTARGLSR
jgi:D-serine deaminase-like pyridoxal phosphate-dependent protein